MKPKGTLGDVLDTHIAQLMTHITNAYIAAAYPTIMLPNVLAYYRW